MKFLASVLGLASVASAHTLFTTFFVDGKNQGDGTCVRQPTDGSTSTAPIYPITGDVMACGRDGNTAVNYICPAPGGARLTFEFRIHPNGEKTGAIAEGHKGPCAVYVKKVDDMFSDSAAGGGWFKIWEDGYNQETDTWCVDTLIKKNGLLSVDLPTGLPSGYYLVRPEVLALHNAVNGDPQFYTSCAQIFVENGPEGPLNIPDQYAVSIPGYVNKDTPGLTYNLYKKELPPYPIPGPEVYIPTSSATSAKQIQEDGVMPSDCLAKNANWCAKPIAAYSGQSECWAAAKSCWAQGETCWDSQPPSGNAGCHQWSDYCKSMNDACSAKKFDGPPAYTAKEHFAKVPGPIPAPWNDIFKGTDVSGGSANGDAKKVTTAAATTQAAKETKVPAATTTLTSAAASAVQTSLGPIYVSVPVSAPVSSGPAATKTSGASPAQTSAAGLKMSEDGRCGGTTGQTCQGSIFGDCCSKKGRCGRKTRHCACGCQAGFGKCGQ